MSTRASLAAVLFAGAFLATSAHAQVRYVNAARPSDGGGTSWADAYKSLANALTAAGTYTEVWVAAGTYTPAASNRSATFTLRNNTAILGGFDGTETSSAQRDPAAHTTTLSGDLLGDDTVGSGNRTDNSYHVVTASNTNASANLDGFTIRSGSSLQFIIPNPGVPGPSLYSVNGSPSISRAWSR